MIISKVEKECEHEGTQIIMVRGSSIEIATEIKNIIKEILKKGFPEELMLSVILEAIEDHHK